MRLAITRASTGSTWKWPFLLAAPRHRQEAVDASGSYGREPAWLAGSKTLSHPHVKDRYHMIGEASCNFGPIRIPADLEYPPATPICLDQAPILCSKGG
eukprot:scaffold14564_cov123-Isochrysis_galbana.AAC.4